MRSLKFLPGRAGRIWFLLTGLLVLSNYTFAHSPHDDAFDVAVSPKFDTDNTVYAIVRNNFLRSTDCGRTWARQVRGLDSSHTLYRMAVADDGKTIYLASLGDGIFRSIDGAETWENASVGLDAYALDRISVAPGRPEFALAAGVVEGLYITDDGGDRWRRVEGAFGKVTAITIWSTEKLEILIGDDRGRIYHSVDEGSSWIRRFEIDGASAIMDIAVASSPDGGPFIFFGTAAGEIYGSVRHGDGFAVSHINNTGMPIVSIVMSPAFVVDGTAMATSWDDGVYCTNSKGADWHRCGIGLTTDSQARDMGRPFFGRLSRSPRLPDDGVAFVAGFDGLFRTTDAGGRWVEVESLSPFNIVALGVSPEYETDRTLVTTNWMWGAYLSEDGGESWRSINDGARDKRRKNGLTRLFNVVFSPDFANDKTIFSSTWWRLLKTENGGDSWRQIVPLNQPVWKDTHHAAGIAVSPGYRFDGTVFLATHRGLVLRSRNRGEDFRIVSDFESFIGSIAVSTDFPDDQIVFVGDTRGVHRSVDAGVTWTFEPLVAESFHKEIPISPAYPKNMVDGWLGDQILNRNKEIVVEVVVAPAFSELGVVFAGTPNGLFGSQDGGVTWRKMGGAPIADAHIEVVAVSPNFSNDGTVVVGVLGQGHFRSVDRGESFREIAAALTKSQRLLINYAGVTPRFPSIVFSPDYARDQTLFGFSGSRLFRSTDRGDKWHVLISPSPELSDRANVWLDSLSRRKKRVLIIASITASVFLALTLYWSLRRNFKITSRSDGGWPD